VPEFENRDTRARARPPLRPTDGEEEDSAERRPTSVHRGPLMTAPPGAPTMQAHAPGPGDTEPQATAGPDFVESPSQVLTPITHKIPTARQMPVPPPIPGVGVPASIVNKDPFDDQTAVASPSEALLRAARDSSQAAPIPVEDGLESEFRSVYRDFIETKQACGESVEGITYDKFSGKLRNNRQQLITRYACKSVKFQVYVKDGKAALKATPITT
jgi:hypothetical protein